MDQPASTPANPKAREKGLVFQFFERPDAMELLQKAIHKSVADLHAAGLPSAGSIDGVPSLRWPDGRIVPINDESRAELDRVLRAMDAAALNKTRALPRIVDDSK